MLATTIKADMESFPGMRWNMDWMGSRTPCKRAKRPWCLDGASIINFLVQNIRGSSVRHKPVMPMFLFA